MTCTLPTVFTLRLACASGRALISNPVHCKLSSRNQPTFGVLWYWLKGKFESSSVKCTECSEAFTERFSPFFMKRILNQTETPSEPKEIVDNLFFVLIAVFPFCYIQKRRLIMKSYQKSFLPGKQELYFNDHCFGRNGEKKKKKKKPEMWF